MHRLDPLLRPASVAIVGASARADSLGEWSLRNLRKGGYAGRIYPVNPRYDNEALQGRRCYASLDALPEVPDLVIFGVGDRGIEAALDDAIDVGVPAAVIMSTLALDDDGTPNLHARVSSKVRDAGMLVCGANGMGFYNVRDRVWACGFDSSKHEPPGNVSLISHSGSGMSGIIDCEARLRTNFAVSTGNEISVTMDEYLDFVLDLPETRAVGLFIEAVRRPEAFRAALDKAAGRGIPVVALKVGRTAAAARLALSHSGALAGDDAVYEALFERYGVTRVRDMDELATTLIMFAELHPVGAGGLATLHDSGGERLLTIDLAADARVPLTELTADTVAALESILDPELPAVNPLDAWSRGGPNAAEDMTRCLTALMQDPGTALAAVIHDRAPDGKIYSSYLSYMQHAHAETDKPVALVAARQGTGSDPSVVTATHAGFPVLDGVSPFLRGARALFDYRDFLTREHAAIALPDAATLRRWRQSLCEGDGPAEAESLALLADADIPVARHVRAADEAETLAAARRIGFPVVLKTAAPAVAHKSERGGVVTGVADARLLADAYRDMAGRLGPDVIVARMAGPGVEMMLGATHDPQFGPVVILGFGGVLAEVLRDVSFAVPPFDAGHARRMVDRLRLRAMLDGVRGAPASDVDAFCAVAERFSVLVDALREDFSEIDVNPVIVHAAGCTAVDALIVRPAAG